MAFNVFLPIVRGWKPRDMEGIEKWFHIYPIALALITGVFGSAFTTAGPLAFWCWIACDEEGIPAENLNHGKCWARVVALYGPLILNCVICLGLLVPMIKVLVGHMRKQKSTGTSASGGNDGVKKGFNKTVSFLGVYSTIVVAASAGRLRNSIKPDPTVEGKMSLTEFSAALIPVFVIGVFSINRWYCPGSKKQRVTDQSTTSTKGNTDGASERSERNLNAKK